MFINPGWVNQCAVDCEIQGNRIHIFSIIHEKTV